MDAASRLGSEHDVELSVRAQALLRVKLGLPILVLMVLAIGYWGPSSPAVGAMEITALALVYTAYNFAALYFARRLQPFSAREIVLATAILDPIMLSGWLLLMGHASIVFVCFYLFTILGFGFRIGVLSMRICQCVSLAGFLGVILASPTWREQPLVALSHMLFLVVVPLYASVLLQKLHAAREHAERESRAKSQLLASVSHELRTPLTGIVSSAQLIETEARDPAIARRAGSILKLSAALDAEIGQLLELSRQQVKPILELAAFDLARVLELLQLSLDPIAAVRDIGFAIRLDDRIRQPVVGSAHDLGSVLMNLAGNAIKFTERGRIDVSVEMVEDRDNEYVLRFSIRDTGIGIPSELHERIFEPFFQVSTGATRRYGGTGLGTTIAKGLVTRMGGELRLESRPGQGSLFWFELRMAKAVSPGVETLDEAPACVVGGKRILVVDDHAANLMLVKEMLRKDRHEVVTADSGAEALECLNAMAFDAIFLDFHMADMDGAQVYELYRFGKIRTAPTFFITADTTRATAKRLLDLGVAGVLYKPITFEKLRAALAGQFQNEALATDALPNLQRQPSAPLKAVPVAYIDLPALDALRDVSDAPEFLAKMLSDGIADMSRLGQELAASLDNEDIDAMRFQAHALKGVCLNLGALRLASLASALMTVSAAELSRSKSQWHGDIESATMLSIDSLRDVLGQRGLTAAAPADDASGNKRGKPAVPGSSATSI